MEGEMRTVQEIKEAMKQVSKLRDSLPHNTGKEIATNAPMINSANAVINALLWVTKKKDTLSIYPT